MNQGSTAYEQIGYNTSNPLKIILMMYDGSITFLKKAITYANAGDIKNKNIYANMARDIIVEFNSVLNIEGGGEIATSLRRLYFFMDRHLMQANWKNDTQGLEEVTQLLSNLRNAWQDIYDQKACLEQPVQHQRPRLMA